MDNITEEPIQRERERERKRERERERERDNEEALGDEGTC